MRSKASVLRLFGFVRGVAALVVGSTLACSSDAVTNSSASDVEIVGITVSPKATSLDANETQSFTAVGLTGVGSTVPTTVTWSTSGGSIDANGVFTPPAEPGTYRVVATHSVRAWLSDTASANVSTGEIPQLRVTPANITIPVGDSADFQAVALFASGDSTEADVTWQANGGGTVESRGVGLARFLAGSQSGQFTVVATDGFGQADTSDVVVTSVRVASVQLVPNDVFVSAGATVQLQAVTRDADGNLLTGRQVSWSSSDSSIVIPTGDGLVIGLASGTATVTAASEGESGTATVTVGNVPVASVTVTPANSSANVGQTAQLTAVPRDAGGNPLSGRTVAWATSNGSVASVSQSGLVTVNGTGSATITATSEGRSGTATVTGTAAPVASVRISPSTMSLLVGRSGTLQATPLDAAGNPLSGRVVAWSSSDTQIASVNASGLVTQVAVGTVTITATSEGQSGTATVTGSDVPVASVEVSPTSASLVEGENVQLTATARSATGVILPNRATTWTSSNPSVASVDPNGLVTGEGEGAATITATSEGQSATAAINVSRAPVASVQITPSSSVLTVGQTAPLSVVLRDASGNVLNGRTVAWSSSNPGVATVSSSGLVSAVAQGSATITASSEGQTGTASVSVSIVPVASVGVSPSSGTLFIAQTIALTATPRDASGNVLSGRSVVWSTSNANVATVNQSGVVTAVALGAVTITATSEGQSGAAAITVAQVPVASVDVSPSSASLVVGENTTLTATPRDAAGNPLTGRTITWTSTNNSVASVNAGGVVTGVGAGSATIRASSGGQVGTASVTVTAVPIASVDVTPTSANVDVGATRQMTATPRDAQGNALTGRTISWTSSASGVASVNGNGLVTGVAAGSATITATSEGQSGSASITVTVAPVASVEVTPGVATRQVGLTVQLTATPRDGAGNALAGRAVTWSTSAAGVASVTQGGLVTGVAEGTATITATSEGQSGTATVTVVEPSAGGVTDLLLLPVATGQTRDVAAYNALNVPGMAAGNSYLDPVTGVRVWKATSATVPVNNAGGGHDYAEGGVQVSREWGGNRHTVLVLLEGGSHYLVDLTRGVGFSNWRPTPPGASPAGDLAFTFSSTLR